MAGDPGWVDRLVQASSGAAARPGLDARVAVAVDGDPPAVLDIRDGRIAGVADGEAEVEVPLTAEQVQGFGGGEVSLAVAYMRGDVKPVGSTARPGRVHRGRRRPGHLGGVRARSSAPIRLGACGAGPRAGCGSRAGRRRCGRGPLGTTSRG